MIDERAEACTSAKIQQAGLPVQNQRDAWDFARIARPRACIVETDNAKKPRIGLEREAYKRRVTDLELDCNICRKRLG